MSVRLMTSDGLIRIADSLVVDSEFSLSSINPIQNKVVTEELKKIEVFSDTIPTNQAVNGIWVQQY